MSENKDVFDSRKENTKELNKMKDTIERLKEDLNLLNGYSNEKED